MSDEETTDIDSESFSSKYFNDKSSSEDVMNLIEHISE
jgi:hypothetical protein